MKLTEEEKSMINQGLEDMKNGQTRPWEEVHAEALEIIRVAKLKAVDREGTGARRIRRPSYITS